MLLLLTSLLIILENYKDSNDIWDIWSSFCISCPVFFLAVAIEYVFTGLVTQVKLKIKLLQQFKNPLANTHIFKENSDNLFLFSKYLREEEFHGFYINYNMDLEGR